MVLTRDASWDDVAARTPIWARGALHVATGSRGLSRVVLGELSVVDHWPGNAQEQIAVAPEALTFEFSGPVASGVELSDFIAVYAVEGGFSGETTTDEAGALAPLFGEDVSDLFGFAFAPVDPEAADGDESASQRVVTGTLVDGAALEENTQYVVIVRRGLDGFGELLPLPSDYVFSFYTVRDADAVPPVLASVTPSEGGIDGGTEVELCGQHFGPTPAVWIGGQPVAVEAANVTLGADVPDAPEGTCDRVVVTTPPNYAGPATVKIASTEGLEDELVGGITYVDFLRISFITPGVVRMAQAGAADEVEIVGQGFHPGVRIRAWRHGDPENVVDQPVDGVDLQILSAQRMAWHVPSFDDAHRGFVDVEVYESALESGQLAPRRHVASKALFYARLQWGGVVAVGSSAGPPDPSALPSGQIVSAAVDADLGLVYVVGAAEQDWMSLVHYDPDAVENAAPMFGLGYYNAPADLALGALTLGTEHVYVAARRSGEPSAEFPHDEGGYVLVYDRELTLPEDEDPSSSEDRQFVAVTKVSDGQAPHAFAVVDDLLVAAVGRDLVFLSLADPAHPGVIRRVALDEAATTLQVHDGVLYARVPKIGGGGLYSFDLRTPLLPEFERRQGFAAHTLAPGRGRLFESDALSALRTFDLAPPLAPIDRGAFDPQGFSFESSGLIRVHATSNLVAVSDPSYTLLYDPSRPDNIELLDGMHAAAPQDAIGAGCGGETGAVVQALSDDGLIVAASPSCLLFAETLVRDLVASEPARDAVGVDPTAPIRLRFSLPWTQEDLDAASSYVSLFEEPLADTPIEHAFQLEVDPQDARVAVLTPDGPLTPSAAHRIELR